MPNVLKNRIKYFREKRREHDFLGEKYFSQTAFAKRLSISRQAFGAIERGDVAPSVVLCLRMVGLLTVSPPTRNGRPYGHAIPVECENLTVNDLFKLHPLEWDQRRPNSILWSREEGWVWSENQETLKKFGR